MQGERPYLERRKGLPAGPRGHPHALPVPAKRPRSLPVASARHRPPKGLLRRIGRIAAGNTAPAEAAGTHLAAHVAVAAAVRHLYRTPLEHYAELVQQFPASESHHHAYPGGMLDHGLEIVAYALKLRQSHLLPIGGSPEDQAAQSEAWTAAVAYAALLHDIGKIAVDLRRTVRRLAVAPGTARCTSHTASATATIGNIGSTAPRQVYSTVNCSTVMPWTGSVAIPTCGDRCSTSWPASTSAPACGLVVQADRASVAQELGGDPARAMAAQACAAAQVARRAALPAQGTVEAEPAGSLRWLDHRGCLVAGKQDGLGQAACAPAVTRRRRHPASNTAVFNVLQDHGMLQPTPDGKAVWRATVTSTTGWSHSFTLLRLAPALIWESGERPAPFAGAVAIDGTPATMPMPWCPRRQ